MSTQEIVNFSELCYPKNNKSKFVSLCLIAQY